MQHRHLTLGLAAIAALGALLVTAGPAGAAGKKTHEDKRLGYRLKIEDDWTQSPPKLTTDSAFIVGDWYQDAAKYESWQLKPTMQLLWFVTPKDDPKAGAEEEKPGTPFDPTDPEAFIRAYRNQLRHKTVDDAVDDFLGGNQHLFGTPVPMSERWAQAEKDKTAGKIEFQSVEVNAPGKKRNKEIHGYAYVAKFTIDRPKETIEVGFLGSCSPDYYKRFSKEFPAIVRSFEQLKSGATDSRNEAASEELSQDRETRYKQILEKKLVPGWKADRTKNYILVYHEEVDAGLVKSIGVQIEAIRAQIYEVLFPPDKPITAFSIVRVCKDRTQYMGYGAPGGSAGYWDANAEELVFYESDPKKDSLRVLYHEAFHQYIFYSVGDFAPHSWFNEGHGDYFAGHNWKGGKFERDVFSWRITDAKEWKHHKNRPPLKDWVNWSQGDYYGFNKLGIPAGLNYAAGWSLVYFLRTTKKPEYQGVLDRYFKTLKGQVTAARNAREAWNEKYKDYEKKRKEWEEKVKEDPTLPSPEPPTESETSDVGSAETWLPKALSEGFKDIDWDAIEKDWLAAPY